MAGIKSIFYLDDDPDDHFIFRMAIRAFEGIAVTSFYSSDELCRHLENELPDIIFLDINLNGENGIDCLKTIKKKERLSAIPVIMYSTSILTDAASKMIGGDAFAYWVKPDSVAELREMLKTIL